MEIESELELNEYNDNNRIFKISN